METLLIRERYKVIQVLEVREHYAFLEAVDIQDREKPARFLNLYDGPLLPIYLACFDSRLPDCLGMFVEDESLAAVFQRAEGPTIDQVFYRGADHHWRTRLAWAERLLHTALSLADLPPRVGCAALLSENLLVDLPGESLGIRWKLVPMEDLDRRELVYLARDQLRKILLDRLASPEEERVFLRDAGACVSVVQLYALWRRAREDIQAAYEAQEKQNPIRRWFCRVWRTFRWRWKNRGGR